MYKEILGVKLINVTSHPIKFSDGERAETLPPSGWLVNARVHKEPVGSGLEVTFVGDSHTKARLEALLSHHKGVIVVGSMIAAKAYPGLVYAPIPLGGYGERKEKRVYRIDQFMGFKGIVEEFLILT